MIDILLVISGVLLCMILSPFTWIAIVIILIAVALGKKNA